MRGEHNSRRTNRQLLNGSSPHAWGTRDLILFRAFENRFIPTCVGNTHPRKPAMRLYSVHPHMRGEHSLKIATQETLFGSSPHAWGTQELILPTNEISRFIPTCVGNTSQAETINTLCAVHPHMRGEHYTDAIDNAFAYGSSPHAWGTHPSHRAQLPLFRFIPTCVGNTLSNKS